MLRVLNSCRIPYLIGVLVLILGGCGLPSPPPVDSPSPEVSPSLPISLEASPSPPPSPSPSPAVPQTIPQKMTTVVLYKVDSQCMNLVPFKAEIVAQNPVEGAIAKVLENQDSADFDLAGYRVSVENGVATVDLRLSPGSQRTFQSLSICEQLALFGGIRKTLVENSGWGITSVQFTQRGQEIVL